MRAYDFLHGWPHPVNENFRDDFEHHIQQSYGSEVSCIVRFFFLRDQGYVSHKYRERDPAQVKGLINQIRDGVPENTIQFLIEDSVYFVGPKTPELLHPKNCFFDFLYPSCPSQASRVVPF